LTPEKFREYRVWSTDTTLHLPRAHNAILPPGTKAGWLYPIDGEHLVVVLTDDCGCPWVFPEGDSRQFFVGFAHDMAFVGPDLADVERLMLNHHEWNAL
jgi:hypothetical protein